MATYTPETTPVRYLLPTPSPFSFSVAASSSRWTPRASPYFGLVMRFLALVFSFVSAISLARPSHGRREAETPANFTQYPELVYCLAVAILAFLYSSFQLFKGVCDIAHRGIIISDKISDYLTFILDQLLGYLLVSSSAVSIPVIARIEKRTTPIWRATVVSASMSFATFALVAICTLLSGYKLCKRIIW